LSWVGTGLLLLLLCDHRSGELPEGCWTKTSLCEHFGESAPALLERLAARGSLAGAADPMAVLVTRARAVIDDILAARDDTERRRATEAAERQRRAEARADEERERERTTGEDRWAASVLHRVPSGTELGLAAVIATPARTGGSACLSSATLMGPP
jgi:hypothetical protein